MGQYVKWLKEKKQRLYKGGSVYWRLYNGALVPADATPVFTALSKAESKKLLKESKAYFIRYSSQTETIPTNWWYIACNNYKKSSLSSNTRSKVNRGNKRCSVKKLSPNWFLDNSYSCYKSAYERYENTNPLDESSFKELIRGKIDGPFDWWGVFFNDTLVGYCECIIEEKDVATNIIKFDPKHFKQYTTYALFDNLLDHYINKENKRVSNGNRSVSHDTNMQDLLLKFNFSKQYCRLDIIYQPYLKWGINILYPFRNFMDKAPQSGLVMKLKSLLFQESIRRSQ